MVIVTDGRMTKDLVLVVKLLLLLLVGSVNVHPNFRKKWVQPQRLKKTEICREINR